MTKTKPDKPISIGGARGPHIQFAPTCVARGKSHQPMRKTSKEGLVYQSEKLKKIQVSIQEQKSSRWGCAVATKSIYSGSDT